MHRSQTHDRVKQRVMWVFILCHLKEDQTKGVNGFSIFFVLSAYTCFPVYSLLSIRHLCSVANMRDEFLCVNPSCVNVKVEHPLSANCEALLFFLQLNVKICDA